LLYLNIPIPAGNEVAPLVEAMRYKPEGCAFDFRWGYSKFLCT